MKIPEVYTDLENLSRREEDKKDEYLLINQRRNFYKNKLSYMLGEYGVRHEPDQLAEELMKYLEDIDQKL